MKSDGGRKDEGGMKPMLASLLQTNRKKKRVYVVLAVSQEFDSRLLQNIEQYIKTNFPNYTVSKVTSLKDLVRQYTRSISLLVIDDQIDTLDEVLSTVETYKSRDKKQMAPILFLSNDVQTLIAGYQKKLALYQESDDYCDLHRLDLTQIQGKLKFALEQRNRRRSRRFKVNLPATFFHLTKDKDFQGEILDISMHGALVKSVGIDQFKVGDQIKLNIPVASYLDDILQGEFLRLSARVRRVFISGDTAGVNFEHVTDSQHQKLTKFLVSLVSDQIK